MNKITLEDLAIRVDRLEKKVFSNSGVGKKVVAVHNAPKKLKDHILDLREEKQFTTPQTADDIHKALEGKYHCEKKRVGVELIRLQTKGDLRKASKVVDGKKLVAYVW